MRLKKSNHNDRTKEAGIKVNGICFFGMQNDKEVKEENEGLFL